VGKTTIELNGKQYDAVTGAFLGDVHTASSRAVIPAPVSAPSTPQHHGRVIDGFIKTPKTRRASPTTPSVVTPVAHAPQQPAKKHSVAGITPLAAHKPEHAKTLMRRAVLKPEAKMKPAIKTQAPAEIAAKPMQALVPKLSASQVDPHRLQHAQTVKRSDLVQKFNRNNQHSRTALHANAHGRAARVAPRYEPLTVQRPEHRATSAAAVQQRPVGTPKERDIFETAIAHATSHEQPAPKVARAHKTHRHRGFVNTLAGITAVLIIGGFVAYLNAPTLEIHFASIQAGFNASMPSYRPTGFALNGAVKANHGVVAINFSSKTTEDTFKVTQQPSSWDSTTLYDNMVAVAGGAKQTIQDHGHTIYVYGSNDVAWVSGGVLYQINGNAMLTNDQITHIAASM
jgi:hypothetical protein